MSSLSSTPHRKTDGVVIGGTLPTSCWRRGGSFGSSDIKIDGKKLLIDVDLKSAEEVERPIRRKWSRLMKAAGRLQPYSAHLGTLSHTYYPWMTRTMQISKTRKLCNHRTRRHLLAHCVVFTTSDAKSCLNITEKGSSPASRV